MRAFIRLLTAVVLVAAVATASHAAGAPRTIFYQGQLRNDTGAALTGTYNLQFSLYDAVSAGNLVWGPEAHNSVTLNNGTFGVYLGSSTLLTDNLFDTKYWIEITVNGNTFSPRNELGAVPYSFNAFSLGGRDSSFFAVAGSSDTDWTINGMTIYHASGKVGIGTSSPSDSLTVVGKAYFGDTVFIRDTLYVRTVAIDTFPNDTALAKLTVGGGIKAETITATIFIGDGSNLYNVPGAWSMNGTTFYRSIGNVGIGTSSRTESLAVMGKVYIGDTLLVRDTVYARGLVIGPGSVASGLYSNVGGGSQNTSSNLYTTVSGGFSNTASGISSFVGGGNGNTASGDWSLVGGGSNNTANGYNSSIGAGTGNISSGSWSSVSGGSGNKAYGSGDGVGAGIGNTVNGGRAYIAGGSGNAVTDSYAFVGGGDSNSANATHSVVVGGVSNSASASYSFIGGGYDNTVNVTMSVVGGGQYNSATGSVCFVGGGQSNTASGAGSFVGGGANNLATDGYSTVSGGQGNQASGNWGTIGGGSSNFSRGQYASTGGGLSNIATGNFSVIPGGSLNQANGRASFAAGYQADAQHDSTFVWSDGDSFVSTAAGQFLIKARGGVGIGTNSPSYPLHMASGAYVSAGGTWTNASSRDYKFDIENFSDDQYHEMLAILDDVNIVRYRYKAEGTGSKEHIGVIAEDAPDELTNESKNGVPTGDAIGYLLAVSKALKDENARLKDGNALLQSQLQALVERISNLEARLQEPATPGAVR